jgi:hypothetical protein
MAVRKRRSTKVKRKRRPGTVRPISKTSPKGKIALLMLEGSHTYAGMAKKTRTTIHNIYQHAAELRVRGHKISVKNGIVRLLHLRDRRSRRSTGNLRTTGILPHGLVSSEAGARTRTGRRHPPLLTL